MSERKIVVPEGMLKAADLEISKIRGREPEIPGGKARDATLHAALQWLAENPIVPTDEQFEQMCRDFHNRHREPPIGFTQSHYLVVEWQRRMFLAPDPDEEIKDLLFSANLADSSTIEIANNKLRDAYRRGLKKREVGE